uniref:Uncharacterized protein n=1 Tax=Marseillevirus sp. TaxID=2809551 RepID=A0AA96J3V7_9VIRU|nr:hypothetical protein MarDSR_496 [Marseillevirus sp.]
MVGLDAVVRLNCPIHKNQSGKCFCKNISNALQKGHVRGKEDGYLWKRNSGAR